MSETITPDMLPPKPPKPQGGGCFFTASILLNVVCLGVIVLVCAGGIFTTFADPESNVPLVEHHHSGPPSAKDKVAIIALDGVIMEGMLGHVHRQIDQAAKDNRVKAVVLRINSPGGTITASDDLLRRLKELRHGSTEKKLGPRPLVVSMASLAASGGYYVAMPADTIFAEKTTITGSIGVYAALPNVAKFGEKYGITMITIKQGEVKDSGSPFKEMSAKDRAVWQDMINVAYNQFIEVVEEGRPKLKHKDGDERGKWPLLERFDWQPTPAGPPDQDPQVAERPLKPEDKTRYLADGGIYPVLLAHKRGLVDEIGDLDAAIVKAKELANLEDAQAIRYERRRSLREVFLGVTAPHPSVDVQALDSASDAAPLVFGPRQRIGRLDGRGKAPLSDPVAPSEDGYETKRPDNPHRSPGRLHAAFGPGRSSRMEQLQSDAEQRHSTKIPRSAESRGECPRASTAILSAFVMSSATPRSGASTPLSSLFRAMVVREPLSRSPRL